MAAPATPRLPECNVLHRKRLSAGKDGTCGCTLVRVPYT
jgi:hypothetical protein